MKMATVNINEIVLKAEGYMKEGHDMERAIVEATNDMKLDLEKEQLEKVREGLSRHAEAIQESNETNEARTEELAEENNEVLDVPEQQPEENDGE